MLLGITSKAMATTNNKCSRVFQFVQIEKAIIKRLNFEKENQQVELLAITEDLFIYKIPYKDSIKELSLEPWLETSKLNLHDSSSLLKAVEKNKILKIEDSLIVSFHRNTSELFTNKETSFNSEAYKKELNDSIEYLKLTLRGSGGFQGPVALMHLWALRIILKSSQAKSVLAEIISWEEWAQLLSFNYRHILNSINTHLQTERYDLREPFYETIDVITRMLASKNGIESTEHFDSIFFKPGVQRKEIKELRIATWNLENFYHPQVVNKIKSKIIKRNLKVVKETNLDQLVNSRLKSKQEMKQIAKNIEIAQPDFLMLTEVELESIKLFAAESLRGTYSVVGIEGNDPFSKNIVLMYRSTLPIDIEIKSNKNERMLIEENGIKKEKRIFSRDLPVFFIREKENSEIKLVLIGAHIRSQGGGFLGEAYARDAREQELLFLEREVNKYSEKYPVITLGDFNMDMRDTVGRTRQFHDRTNSFNATRGTSEDFTMLHEIRVSRVSLERELAKSNKKYSSEEIAAMKAEAFNKNLTIKSSKAVDAINIGLNYQEIIRSSYIHKLVDAQGVLLNMDQIGQRATDHNMPVMVLDIGKAKQ